MPPKASAPIRSDPTNEHEWFPTPETMARYVTRDAVLAVGNAAILAAQCEPRYRLTITNGRLPGQGYASISVLRGDIDPGDTLHSPATIGRAITNRLTFKVRGKGVTHT